MALTPEQINDYVSKLFNDPMGEVYRLAKFETEARSKMDRLQEEVKDAYQQRDRLAVEVGNLQKELVEVSQRRDRLTIENAGLHGKLDNLNDRITELENENKDLKASNAANAHLSQDVLKLRKENEALKKGNEETPTTNTEEKKTVTIEAWFIGSSVDKFKVGDQVRIDNRSLDQHGQVGIVSEIVNNEFAYVAFNEEGVIRTFCYFFGELLPVSEPVTDECTDATQFESDKRFEAMIGRV